MTKFIPGQSGNPQGKAKGTISKRSQLAKLLEPHAEELIDKAVELAKSGEVNALRLCIERLLPKPKDEPVYLQLPQGDLRESKALLDVGVCVIESVAEGNLTPEQGKTMTSILESFRKTIETDELASRILEIESTLSQKRDLNNISNRRKI